MVNTLERLRLKPLADRSGIDEDFLQEIETAGPRVVLVESVNYAIQSLKDRPGMEPLGEGCYGAAWGRGSVAWKHSHPWAMHDGWLDWALTVLRGEVSGPHVPRIRRLFLAPNCQYLACMERLSTTLHDLSASDPWASFRPGAVFRRTAATIPADDLAAFHGPFPCRYTEQARSVARLIQDVNAICHDIGRQTDCHDQNIMVRRDGTVVVTDPWA